MPLTPEQYEKVKRANKSWTLPEGDPKYISPDEIKDIKNLIGVNCPMRPLQTPDIDEIGFSLSPGEVTKVEFSGREAKLIGQLRTLGIIDIIVNPDAPEPAVFRGSGTEYYYECDDKHIRIHICRGDIKSFDIIIKKAMNSRCL